MKDKFEKIYNGFPNENIYRKNIVNHIKSANTKSELIYICSKIDYSLSSYDIIRIAKAYKTGEKDLIDKIGYILTDINFNSLYENLKQGKADIIIEEKKRLIKRDLEEDIIYIFENQLNKNRNCFEIPKDSKYLQDYSQLELDYLINQKILKVTKLSNIAFKLEQSYIDEFLEKKWEELTDVLFKEEDSIEILDGEYWDFLKGVTTKEDIWHYFDENYSKGIYYLIYELEGIKEENIVNTEELVDRIKDMQEINLEYMKKIANTLNMSNTHYTFELRHAMLDKIEAIELNHLEEKLSVSEIKEDLIDVITEISELYGVKIEDAEDDETRE